MNVSIKQPHLKDKPEHESILTNRDSSFDVDKRVDSKLDTTVKQVQENLNKTIEQLQRGFQGVNISKRLYHYAAFGNAAGEYVATENCYAICGICGGGNNWVGLNGYRVLVGYGSGDNSWGCIPMNKGDKLTWPRAYYLAVSIFSVKYS